MQVISIQEDNHGQIGIALNYYNAIQWLIGNKWITDHTEICTGEDYHSYVWKPITEVLGEDWADKMLEQWDIDTFNDYWEGSFLLQSINLIGTEEDE